MKKAKKSETMKMLIKKIAVVACAATLAFSMIPATVQAAGWKQNKNGYWWQENDYSYPKNQWKTIYGKQYHFNSGGYMDTGWTKVDGRWYYLGARNEINKFQILSQLLIQRRHIPVHKRFHIRRGSDWTAGFFIDPTGHFDCRQRIVIHSSCRIDLFAHSHLVQKFHHIGALYLRRNLNGIDPVDFYFLFHNFCIRIHGNIHTFGRQWRGTQGLPVLRP